MNTYIALLRGVNVGGKNKLPMTDLVTAMTTEGFTNVRSYIQSGNIIFTSASADTAQLADQISARIINRFQLNVATAVKSKQQWHDIVTNAPAAWGNDAAWKHNLIVLLPPYTVTEALAAIGPLKPAIEIVAPGDGVLYQSLSWHDFGKTASGRIAAKPIYQGMTIRNYNTVVKLLDLL